MTYVTKLADGPTELDRVWRLRPQYYELFMQDYHRSIERLDPVLIEVCRLWMATLLGSRLDLSLRYKPAVDAGLTRGQGQRDRELFEVAALHASASASASTSPNSSRSSRATSPTTTSSG